MPDAERCPVCGRRFVAANGVRVACAVVHPPGSCCHYGESEVVLVGEPGPELKNFPKGDSVA